MAERSIKLDGLSLKFGKYIALDNINLLIEDNSFVTIVGPNGGGKTTLLKILLGLLKPTSGKVIFNGIDNGVLPAGSIGYVPQIKTLDRTFPAMPVELVASGIKSNWITKLTSKENILVMKALERVGAAHLAKRQLNRLSGGELQRIYLARSFIREPEILLLDEPATGIDLLGENDIHNIIEDYRKDKSGIIIMVTHDWEAAYHHANKVLLLNRSQICYDSPDKAFAEQNLRKAFSHIGHKHEMVFGAHSHV